MKIRCVVIDDEFLARKYLMDYIEKVPSLELIGDFNSPLKAGELLQQSQVDLLFMDIQMPEMNGLEFLRTLRHKPQVILTTAYSEYALEGYELDVADYLLKPFSFQRFLEAVHKAERHMILPEATPGNLQQPNAEVHTNYIVIRADRKFYKINYPDLLYIEGQKAYVTFHYKDKHTTALFSMKELEERLPSEQFIRIHKSFIVSINKIEILEGNQLTVGEKRLPVGKSYREQVMRLFQPE
ncbi:MAG: LytTR family DNA-binding domain-containing protein [Bacteroidales bacterium]